MAITKDDIQKEGDKEYLPVRYTNSNLELLKTLTDKLGYEGDYEKTLMLGLAAVKELTEKKVVQLNDEVHP